MTKKIAIITPAALHEERMDIYLTRYLMSRGIACSRSGVQRWIREGRLVEGSDAGGRAICEPDKPVRPNHRYALLMPPPPSSDIPAQKIPLVILYEDSEILVIDKPAGIVAHPAPGHRDGTLVNALLAHCGEGVRLPGGVTRPGIVHRLDKDTSGVMVLAKSDAAYFSLIGQFASHGRDGSLERRYLAFVRGVPVAREGVVDRPIGRHVARRHKMASYGSMGVGRRPARTRYEVLRSYGDVAGLILCRPETGRTHQIRAHLAWLGHAVIGDSLYGGRRGDVGGLIDRQALHAAWLSFSHPVSGERLSFESPTPSDMEALRSRLLELESD